MPFNTRLRPVFGHVSEKPTMDTNESPALFSPVCLLSIVCLIVEFERKLTALLKFTWIPLRRDIGSFSLAINADWSLHALELYDMFLLL